VLAQAQAIGVATVLAALGASRIAQAEDAPAKPVVTVVEGEAHLTLQSDPPGVALYRGVPAAGTEPAWEVVCTAPCTFVMREGNYPLALSWGGNTKPVGTVAVPSGNHTVYARWKEARIS